MTSRLLLLLLAGCAVQPPPEPRPIVCEEIDRAAERFPDECGELGDAAASDADAVPDDGADAGADEPE
jgi:hypothetical protein